MNDHDEDPYWPSYPCCGFRNPVSCFLWVSGVIVVGIILSATACSLAPHCTIGGSDNQVPIPPSISISAPLKDAILEDSTLWAKMSQPPSQPAMIHRR